MTSSITSLSPPPGNGKHEWYDQFQMHAFFKITLKLKY